MLENVIPPLIGQTDRESIQIVKYRHIASAIGRGS
jgi:hypothetical protein